MRDVFVYLIGAGRREQAAWQRTAFLISAVHTAGFTEGQVTPREAVPFAFDGRGPETAAQKEAEMEEMRRRSERRAERERRMKEKAKSNGH